MQRRAADGRRPRRRRMATSSARTWRDRSWTRAQGRPRRVACCARPTPAAVERLLDAGRGTVRQVTLAPELPGALDAIRLVVAAGAAAAVGHTGADLAGHGRRLRRGRDDPHPRVQRDAGAAPSGAGAGRGRGIRPSRDPRDHRRRRAPASRGRAHRVRGRARARRPRHRRDGRSGARGRALRTRSPSGSTSSTASPGSPAAARSPGRR